MELSMAATAEGNSRDFIRLTNLDGLRGVAIAVVVLFHTYSRWAHVTPWSETSLEEDFFSYGWLGVNLFFIISGFVIFWSLEKSSSFISFGIKRWLRLFPAMLLASVLIFTTASLFPDRPSGPPDVEDLWPGLLFIQPGFLEYFFVGDIQSLDGAFWSLFVEVKFYVISAAAYFYLKDRNAVVVTALFALYVLSDVLSGFFGVDAFVPLYEASRIMDFNYFGWFASGIFFYKYWLSGKKIYCTLSLLCALASTATEMADRNDAFISLFGTLVYVAFVFSFYDNALSRFFVSRPMLFLGFISYPLYLIHQNLIIGMGIRLHFFSSQLNDAWYSVAPLFLVVGASFVIARLEPFVKRFLRGLLDQALSAFSRRIA